MQAKLTLLNSTYCCCSSSICLHQEWFKDTLSLTEQHRPRILLLTLMPYLAGGFRVAEVLEQQQDRWQGSSSPDAAGRMSPVASPQIMVAYTVPAHPTWAFLPASAGLGFTAPFGFLNR